MKKYILIGLTLITFDACTKVPVTGRRQLNLLPEDQMVNTALAQYNDFLVKNPPVALSNSDADMVKKLGNKLSLAVVKFLAENKQSHRVAGFKWEFNLVDNKEANAWCMPGGKVVVYTGLLPVTKDEKGLAFVMGHEIAHAVARHGNERMSQQLAVQSGGMALDIALMQQPNETRQLFNMAYGLGSTVGAILPFSRLHESEADKLGMIFMALAGYDPTSASNVWTRMAAGGGQKPPQILSTHPTDAKRKSDMDAFLPQAMKYYKPNK